LTDNHRHSWTPSSRRGNKITFSCDECKQEWTRRITENEQGLVDKIEDLTSKDTHDVWWEFQSEFMDGASFNNEWKMVGSDLQDAIMEWAEKYPDMVWVSACDDSWFASSIVVLIQHGTGDNYMGLSVVVVPQLDGQNPFTFFLYPGHAHFLMKGLEKHRGEYLPMPEDKGDDAAWDTWEAGFQEQYESKPSTFDVFRKGGLDKEWYKGKL
jgi:hypothetical protein